MPNPYGTSKNLKKWKRGQSGNPNGRPRNSAPIKELENCTSLKFSQTFHKYSMMRVSELKVLIKDPDLPAYDAIIISQLFRSFHESRTFFGLLDRVMGKPTFTVEHTHIHPEEDNSEYEKAKQLLMEALLGEKNEPMEPVYIKPVAPR